MKFSNVMSNAGEWLRGEGPHHQIVVSSRVRLARNLGNRAFPGWAKKAERTAILESYGYRVVRFSNEEVMSDLPLVLSRILGACNQDCIDTLQDAAS